MTSGAFVGPGESNPDHTRAVLSRALDIGIAFKRRPQPFAPSAQRPDLGPITQRPLPWEGRPVEEVLDELETDLLPAFVNMASPRFTGFPDAGNSLAALAGAVLGELLNANLINSSISGPGATEIELNLIRWLRELVGYHVDDGQVESAIAGGGVPTHGGTGANLAATLLARNRLRTSRGRDAAREMAVLVPEHIGHYTMAAAAEVSGLSENALVTAPIDGFRYDLVALRGRLRGLRDAGVLLGLAVAYAGDSRTMTVDDLHGFAAAVREFFPEAWLHCDGCHGTSLIFSERHRHRVDGLASFDSVSLDAHKVLAVPLPSSFLLVRDPKDLHLIATTSELILREPRSMGQITPGTGSRAFASLRLWTMIATEGVRGIGRMIDTRIELAQAFAQRVDAHPRLRRLNEAELNAVAFVVLPAGVVPPLSAVSLTEVDHLNAAVFDRMLVDGEFYLHSFELPDARRVLSDDPSARVRVLRYMSGNPLIDASTQDALIDYVVRTADGVSQ